MAHSFFAVLHGGPGSELTLLGYLFGILLHLLAFGAIVVLGLRSPDVAGAARSVFSSLGGHQGGEARD